jgi:hypothetical protein
MGFKMEVTLMAQKEDLNERKLRKMLREFPWLWPTRSVWQYWRHSVEVRRFEPNDLRKKVKQFRSLDSGVFALLEIKLHRLEFETTRRINETIRSSNKSDEWLADFLNRLIKQIGARLDADPEQAEVSVKIKFLVLSGYNITTVIKPPQKGQPSILEALAQYNAKAVKTV